MTPKQTIKLLETEFKNKVDIVTSPTFKSKSVEDKIAELAKMYKAGQNIQRMLNDGNGLKPEEIKQYRGRVLTGFKKLKAIMLSISAELSAEEDAVAMVKAKASQPVSESKHNYVKSYKTEFAGPDGIQSERIENFTQIQADMVHAFVDDKGIPIIYAKKLVDEWNRINKVQKSNYKYSLV